MAHCFTVFPLLCKTKYDWFEEKAKAVWAYNRNLNQYRVDTGLITQESFDEMQWLYPHYVPTYRVDSNSGIASIEGKYNLAIKKTVKGAKGSTKRLISPEVIIARQTMETIPAGRENQLTRKLAEAAERRGKNNFIEVVSTKKLTAEELAELDPTTIRPKGGQITYFKDGEMQTLSLILEELNKDQYYDYAIMQRLGLSRKRYYAIKSVVLDKVERIILSDGYKEATKKQ